MPITVEEQNRLTNALMTVWSADTHFVLDQLEQLNRSDPSNTFTGRLNLQAVGIFGHSFGGATAAQFCHDDNRCKAGIDIDGAPYGSVVRESLHQPFLFLTSDHGDTTDAADPALSLPTSDLFMRAFLQMHDSGCLCVGRATSTSAIRPFSRMARSQG